MKTMKEKILIKIKYDKLPSQRQIVKREITVGLIKSFFLFGSKAFVLVVTERMEPHKIKLFVKKSAM